MAAIIAQLTRNKRERAAKISYETNKCMYYIPPFDQHFDPYVHNKYLGKGSFRKQPFFNGLVY